MLGIHNDEYHLINFEISFICREKRQTRWKIKCKWNSVFKRQNDAYFIRYKFQLWMPLSRLTVSWNSKWRKCRREKRKCWMYDESVMKCKTNLTKLKTNYLISCIKNKLYMWRMECIMTHFIQKEWDIKKYSVFRWIF